MFSRLCEMFGRLLCRIRGKEYVRMCLKCGSRDMLACQRICYKCYVIEFDSDESVFKLLALRIRARGKELDWGFSCIDCHRPPMPGSIRCDKCRKKELQRQPQDRIDLNQPHL